MYLEKRKGSKTESWDTPFFGDLEDKEDLAKKPWEEVASEVVGNRESAEARWRKVFQLRVLISAIKYCSKVKWDVDWGEPVGFDNVEVTGNLGQRDFQSVW